ncbi:MAG: FkbM family methyltransferase [Lewinellaceae bacterium]|nr:FkbM family methyltransferase [Lewinellaceae bacterium]
MRYYHRSYAQDGEDVVLQSFFQDKKHYKGFFVDVGAHHPIRFSNTWMLYRKGWRGINIDPTPGSMRPFRWLRRRDINLEMGIGAAAGNLTFQCFNEPALNTFDPALASERNTGNPYKIVRQIEVPVDTLGHVLDQYLPAGQPIDFFTIDVEGLDMDVLKSNHWDKYRPQYVLVEDLLFNIAQPGASEVHVFLETKGYQLVAKLHRTLIYQTLPA